MVIAFDDWAETLTPFTSDTRVLKNVIDSIQPTDRRSKLAAAYQLADAAGGVLGRGFAGISRRRTSISFPTAGCWTATK